MTPRRGTGTTGAARTALILDDFGLTRPRVPVVLGPADTIHLEYDLDPVRAGS